VSAAELTLAPCAADIIELAARGGRREMLETRLAAALPACGALQVQAQRVILGHRPGRWLILSAPEAPGSAADRWRAACGDAAAVIELSSGLDVLHLAGAALREMLARGCRLDLDPALFPAGRVAATIIAQVSTILAALPSGMLILTPASTARHLREWLATAAQPFGFAARPALAFTALSGDPRS
jgi:heterotetrameric sarcosine oxidase gamma subunit